MIMTITEINTGMMNIGMSMDGMIIIGCITLMATTVFVTYGGTHGGGTGIGGEPVGVITGTGTFSTPAFMSSGIVMDAGGSDPVMVAGYGTVYRIHIMNYGTAQN